MNRMMFGGFLLSHLPVYPNSVHIEKDRVSDLPQFSQHSTSRACALLPRHNFVQSLSHSVIQSLTLSLSLSPGSFVTTPVISRFVWMFVWERIWARESLKLTQDAPQVLSCPKVLPEVPNRSLLPMLFFACSHVCLWLSSCQSVLSF